ncbi:MAG: AmmeMemoRadiSam system protein A [Candidatus Gracilibacteria bacterium]|jgi:AmmeMemoRadiSam system protein A|nr:AmmeMemoRadiSam system protein A [Candidatus Gracilibacteria bacterium]
MIQAREKNFLLSLARKSIESHLNSQKIEKPNVPDALKEKKATFVSISKNQQLRGCIGRIHPLKPLYVDIIENAINAGFKDPRFKPLSKRELNDIKISISILSNTIPIAYAHAKDLIEQLSPGYGFTVSKNGYRAVYLPEVWGNFNSKEEFISSLCSKAGLERGIWRFGELEVRKFSVNTFSEN